MVFTSIIGLMKGKKMCYSGDSLRAKKLSLISEAGVGISPNASEEEINNAYLLAIILLNDRKQMQSHELNDMINGALRRKEMNKTSTINQNKERGRTK